jgi:hypothetical protein
MHRDLARFDSVVAVARTAHSSCQKHNGYIHFVSARALEQKNLKPEAMGEYLIFLQECPHDVHAKIAAQQIEAYGRMSVELKGITERNRPVFVPPGREL